MKPTVLHRGHFLRGVQALLAPGSFFRMLFLVGLLAGGGGGGSVCANLLADAV
ncbi:MAG: hypothetical protein N3A68_05000 [Bacteroidia bacterium]|nr:hypothetical protein [Bacteroidia bacterium]